MKLKKEFIMREIAGEYYLVPVGETVLSMNGLIALNEVAARIYQLLPEAKDENEIVEKLLQEYDVDRESLQKDVDAFIGKLKELSML